MFSLVVGFGILLLAGFAVFAAVAMTVMVVKFAFKLVLLPLKLLVLPIVAVFFVAKVAVLFALGVALVAVFVAIIVPLVVIGLIVAVPFALISALT